MTKEKTKKEVGASVADTIKEIKKKFGDDAVMMLNQAAMDVEIIPTGSFGLDLALGVGGYPRGRVIEISGNISAFFFGIISGVLAFYIINLI